MGVEVIFCDVVIQTKKVKGIIRPEMVTGVVSVTPSSGGNDLVLALGGIAGSGVVMANGRAVTSRDMQRRIAVTGTSLDDSIEDLTVEENLSHRLELHTNVTSSQRREDMTVLLDKMMLKEDAAKLVRDVPLAVRRRLLIAMEMCMKPDLLVLLDPTDGQRLDHSMELVRLLAEAAHHSGGPTVVFSVSNLRWGVLQMCDDIILMDRGEIAFHGPRETVVPYFMKLGFELDGTSACDMLMETLMAEATLGGSQSALAHQFRATAQYRQMEAHLVAKPRSTSSIDRSTHDFEVDPHHVHPNVFWVTFVLYKYSIRVVRINWVTYVVWLLCGICLSMFLLKVVQYTNNKTQNRMGVLFMVLTAFYHLNHLSVTPVRLSALQRRRSLLLCVQFVVSTSHRMMTTMFGAGVIGSLVYYLGLKYFGSTGETDLQGGNFKDFVTAVSMTSFSHSCFVYLLGTLPLAHAQHYFGLMIFFLFNMLTCGFWLNIRTLPVVVARVSLLRWGYEAVMINQLSPK